MRSQGWVLNCNRQGARWCKQTAEEYSGRTSYVLEDTFTWFYMQMLQETTNLKLGGVEIMDNLKKTKHVFE